MSSEKNLLLSCCTEFWSYCYFYIIVIIIYLIYNVRPFFCPFITRFISETNNENGNLWTQKLFSWEALGKILTVLLAALILLEANFFHHYFVSHSGKPFVRGNPKLTPIENTAKTHRETSVMLNENKTLNYSPVCRTLGNKMFVANSLVWAPGFL